MMLNAHQKLMALCSRLISLTGLRPFALLVLAPRFLGVRYAQSLFKERYFSIKGLMHGLVTGLACRSYPRVWKFRRLGVSVNAAPLFRSSQSGFRRVSDSALLPESPIFCSVIRVQPLQRFIAPRVPHRACAAPTTELYQ